MRRKFIAGNWKMNHGPAATSEFFSKFGAELKDAKEVQEAVAAGTEEIAFFVPAVSLLTAVNTAKELPVIVGAENMHWEKSGAFTGETSGPMITEIGATHVLIGHSRRRNARRARGRQSLRRYQEAVRRGAQRYRRRDARS